MIRTKAFHCKVYLRGHFRYLSGSDLFCNISIFLHLHVIVDIWLAYDPLSPSDCFLEAYCPARSSMQYVIWTFFLSKCISLSFWEFFQNHRMIISRLCWLIYSVFKTEYEEYLVSRMCSSILILWMSLNVSECVCMSFSQCLSISCSSEGLLAYSTSPLCPSAVLVMSSFIISFILHFLNTFLLCFTSSVCLWFRQFSIGTVCVSKSIHQFHPDRS